MTTYYKLEDGVRVEMTPTEVSQLEADMAGRIAGVAESMRSQRDNILATVVDPIVTNPLRWADLTEAKQAEWTAYRTALLDITDQAGFPTDITWPTKPE
jgi:hypothetical protein